MAKKYFTLDQANRTLPLVRRIVQDIVDEYRLWKESLARYEAAAGRERPEHGESAQAIELRGEVDAIAQRINGYIAELELIGCVLRGFDDGLVDFRARMEGRDVYLCWKLGEDDVAFWHDVDGGFRNRRPLAPEGAGGVGPS